MAYLQNDKFKLSLLNQGQGQEPSVDSSNLTLQQNQTPDNIFNNNDLALQNYTDNVFTSNKPLSSSNFALTQPLQSNDNNIFKSSNNLSLNSGLGYNSPMFWASDNNTLFLNSLNVSQPYTIDFSPKESSPVDNNSNAQPQDINPKAPVSSTPATPTSSTATPLKDGSQVNDKNNGNTGEKVKQPTPPSLDTQTKKWFGLTDAQWNALTPEEKQNKSNIALKGMIVSYNDNQVKIWNNISDANWSKLSEKQKQDYRNLAWKDVDPKTGEKRHCKRMTVAEQYSLYLGRCSSEDEVIRLTKTVISMNKEDQLNAFKNSYQYKNLQYRDLAEGILSRDYVYLHRDNIPGAVEETKKFAIKNQVIAAESSAKVPVDLQPTVVENFASRNNHDIDMALSNNEGKYGVTYDADGKPISVDKDIQFSCYKNIVTAANDCRFSDVVQNSAKNICTLDKDNQAIAVKSILSTGDIDAINVAASQFSNYDKSAQSDIANIINSSNYDSAKVTLAQAAQNLNDDSVKVNSIGTSSDTANTNTKTSDNDTVNAVTTILDSSITNKDLKIAEVIKNASEADKLVLLKTCPSMDVIKAILASGPSMEVMSKIMDILSDFDDRSKKELIGAILDSNLFKGQNSNRIGSQDVRLQVLFVQKLAPEDLKYVNANSLTPIARDSYNKRLDEFNKQGKTQASNKKFGFLNIA